MLVQVSMKAPFIQRTEPLLSGRATNSGTRIFWFILRYPLSGIRIQWFLLIGTRNRPMDDTCLFQAPLFSEYVCGLTTIDNPVRACKIKNLEDPVAPFLQSRRRWIGSPRRSLEVSRSHRRRARWPARRFSTVG